MNTDREIKANARSTAVPLRFNQLLTSAGIDPSLTRLLRHQTRLVDGRTPIDLWRTDPAPFEAYQAYQLTAYRAYFRARWWASFVGTADGRTMFVGLYNVDEPVAVENTVSLPPWLNVETELDGYYPSRRNEMLGEYIRRLYVEWDGENSGKRARRQRAEAQDKTISELHLDVAERPFPALLNLGAPLSMVETAPPLWVA